MILKSTLPIEILNVISSSVDNGVFEVKSFPIIGDIDREAIVKNAEDYFVKCIRQLRHTENITEEDINNAIEDGFFSNDDFEIYLTWSD